MSGGILYYSSCRFLLVFVLAVIHIDQPLGLREPMAALLALLLALLVGFCLFRLYSGAKRLPEGVKPLPGPKGKPVLSCLLLFIFLYELYVFLTSTSRPSACWKGSRCAI